MSQFFSQDQFFSLAQLVLGALIALASATLTNYIGVRRAEQIELQKRLQNDSDSLVIGLVLLWRLHFTAKAIADSFERQSEVSSAALMPEMRVFQRVSGVSGLNDISESINFANFKFLVYSERPDVFFRLIRMENLVKVLVSETSDYGRRREEFNRWLKGKGSVLEYDPETRTSRVTLSEEKTIESEIRSQALDDNILSLMRLASEASGESKELFEEVTVAAAAVYKDVFPKLAVIWEADKHNSHSKGS